MKKTRILALLLCLVMLSAMFVGCTPIKNLGKPYEITWYNLSSLSKDNDKVFAKVSEYTKDKIGVTVKYMPLPGAEFKQKVPLLLASKEKIDMIFTASYQNFTTNVANGYYMELNDLIEKYGKELKKTVPEYFWNGTTVKGKIYAVPTTKEAAHHWVLTYQEALAKKYNLDMSKITKIEDIEPMLKVIKENEPDKYPLYYTAGGSLFNLLPYDSVIDMEVPGAFDVDTGVPTIVNQYDTDKAKQYFATVRDFYEKGYVRKDIDSVKELRDVENTDKYFMGLAATLPYLEDVMKKSTKFPFNWIYSASYPIMSQGDLMGSMQAIPASCENPEAVMKFINLLNTDKYLRNLVAYGIQDEHYVKTADNEYDLPEGIKSPNDNSYSTYNFTIGNMFLTYIRKGTPQDLWAKYDEFTKSAKKSPGLGFVFDGANYTNQMAEIRNVYNEYMPSLLTGAVDPNVKLPQALAKFKLAGLDEVIKAAQAQYDAMKK